MDVSGYVFKYFEWPHPEVYFQVKSSDNVHLAIAPDEKYEDGVNEDDVYEFVIGGWGNQKSVIRRGNQGKELATAETIDIVSAEEYRGFWISTVLRDGKLELKLGKTGDVNALMTGLDENPVEIKYLGLASWSGVTASYKDVRPVNGSVLIRDCGLTENFGCDLVTDNGMDLKYCNCPEEDCNINWNYAGYTERGQQCYRCNSDEEDCDGSNPGKVVNCPTDNGCLLSYATIAGKSNVFIRDCAIGGEKKCERIDSGSSILRFCNCDGDLCNEGWNSAGSTSAAPTHGPPTPPHTTEHSQNPTHITDYPTTTTTVTTSSPSSACKIMEPLFMVLFIFVLIVKL